MLEDRFGLPLSTTSASARDAYVSGVDGLLTAAADAERLRLTPEGRKLVRAETRTLVHRDSSGKQTRYRVTLDDKVMRVEASEAPSGQPLGEPRFQRLWFDSDSQARDAYFARLDRLATEGFIDTDALSA